MNKVSPTQNTPALQAIFPMENYMYMYDLRQKTSAEFSVSFTPNRFSLGTPGAGLITQSVNLVR